MTKNFIKIMAILCALLFIFACKVEDTSIKTVDDDLVTSEDVYKENIDNLSFEKEEYRQLFIEASDELQKSRNVLGLYKNILNVVDIDEYKEEVRKNIYNFNFSVGEAVLKQNNVFDKRREERIFLSYNLLSDEIKEEYKNIFNESLANFVFEDMIKIETKNSYTVSNYIIGDTVVYRIDFSSDDNLNDIRIVFDDSFLKISDFDFEFIDINYKN
ncbi:hypothetical protein [Ezakiella peruensis]|uniref:hypothetical protein n=1 Tax=Ezakiella peruensis TaxID=1464038 RepID=UPI000C1B12C4|nr:hypothetical protein [Ezakiella peruensis]